MRGEFEKNISENSLKIYYRQDRLEKCRQNGARLESEKRHLQEELARCEGRASKLDLQRVALEGDIQRLQMALQEKDNHLRNIQERLENQTRSSMQLEDRFVSKCFTRFKMS